MERIKKAVEIAKANRSKLVGPYQDATVRQRPIEPRARAENESAGPVKPFDGGNIFRLNKWHLQSHRIVSDDGSDPRGRSFEMLRTHLTQKLLDMDIQSLGITSPTSGCGKTVCSINLAFSIARLPERKVTLIDLDLRKPQVAGYLGLKSGPSVENLLRGEATLNEISILPDGLQGRLRILPTFRSTRDAAEHLSSSRLKDLIVHLKNQDPRGLILIDLPPVLVVDDVLSFLPNVDSLLLIAASGQTTMTDLINAERIVGSNKILGVVLNKSEDQPRDTSYY